MKAVSVLDESGVVAIPSVLAGDQCAELVAALDGAGSFLLGPTRAVGVWDTFLDRNTKILVQRDKPVIVRGLVEERALNRHSTLGKERPDLGVRFQRGRKPLADGNIEHTLG